MKNNLLYIFSLIFVLTICNSCSDELELFPETAIAVENAFNSPADFENALKGVYSGFRRSGYYGGGSTSLYFMGDIISDNVIINSNGRRSGETYYDWRYGEDSSTEAFWLSAYKVVQRSNLILENIDILADGDNKNNVRGEALAARGIAHFDLVRLYGDSPNNPSTNSLGIPFVTSTDAELKPSRDGLNDTYTNILSDLNQALGLINDDNGSGRLNKNAVAGLLSRVYLFMGDYTNVISSANMVTGVSPVTRDQYFNLWKDETDDGVLWKILINEPDNISIGVTWLQESPDGIRSEYNVDYDFFNDFKDDDIRKEVWFETSAFAGVDYNHMIKYRGRLTGDANVVDAKCIRYSEVLLNKAEALAQMGDDAGALAALDAIRSERYEDFNSGGETGDLLKSRIQRERRFELAFEGDRFYTLKRLGLPIQRSSFGDKADGTGEEAEFQTMQIGDHRFNMAIGQGEIDANENMVQNTGY